MLPQKSMHGLKHTNKLTYKFDPKNFWLEAKEKSPHPRLQLKKNTHKVNGRSLITYEIILRVN